MMSLAGASRAGFVRLHAAPPKTDDARDADAPPSRELPRGGAHPFFSWCAPLRIAANPDRTLAARTHPRASLGLDRLAGSRRLRTPASPRTRDRLGCAVRGSRPWLRTLESSPRVDSSPRIEREWRRLSHGVRNLTRGEEKGTKSQDSEQEKEEL
jgi:hypothetical protein